MAKWLFDDTFEDAGVIRNATGVNHPSFLPGYVNQSVLLNATFNQSVVASHIPLTNTSFSITTWFNVSAFVNPVHHGLFGICSIIAANKCLYLTIRQTLSNYYLYMDFYGNSCQGTINILVRTWYHVGFVFDKTTMTQSIYLNGELDQSCSVSSPLMLTPSTLTSIGNIPLLIPINGSNFFNVSSQDPIFP